MVPGQPDPSLHVDGLCILPGRSGRGIRQTAASAAATASCRQPSAADPSDRRTVPRLARPVRSNRVRPGRRRWISTLPARGAGTKHDRRNVGMRLAKSAGIPRPHDIKGRGQRVGLGRRGGQHAGRQHALGRPAGARIENVAVAPPLVHEELRARAGGGQGAVRQPQVSQSPLGVQRIAHAHVPARVALGRACRRERRVRARCCCRRATESRATPADASNSPQRSSA